MCHLQTKSNVATAWRAPVEISACGLLRISAKTVWKRLYGAQVKRISASTLAWSCDLLTEPKILESRLLPRLSPATKYIPSGTTTCFKSPQSRHAIVGSESLTSWPAAVVTKILHAL